MTEIYCNVCLGPCTLGHPSNHWEEICPKNICDRDEQPCCHFEPSVGCLL